MLSSRDVALHKIPEARQVIRRMGFRIYNWT